MASQITFPEWRQMKKQPLMISLPVEHVYSISVESITEQTLRPDFPSTMEYLVCAIKKQYPNLPWFAEIANYLAAQKEPVKFTGNDKQKFLRGARHYYWDEPFLYRNFKDGVFRRCVSEYEIPGILFQCHGSSYALQRSKPCLRSSKPAFGGQQCSKMPTHTSLGATHAALREHQ